MFLIRTSLTRVSFGVGDVVCSSKKNLPSARVGKGIMRSMIVHFAGKMKRWCVTGGLFVADDMSATDCSAFYFRPAERPLLNTSTGCIPPKVQ